MKPWPRHDHVDLQEVGRTLGHDLYTLSQLPRQGAWPPTVREGFDAAAHAGLRRHHADRFTAKWLQLRQGAWMRERAVADDVTPALIQDLDVIVCPITRCTLTHSTRTDTDWSVDRLNNDGAYVASNLAVMSVRANRAKGALSFAQVMACANSSDNTGPLSRAEWLRLAALMLGPCHLQTPLEAPSLPLCASLPKRSARLALQQVQRLLTEHSRCHADKNRLVKTLSTPAGDDSRHRLSFLAERVHRGLKHHGQGEDRWDVWLQPEVMAALNAWQASLTFAEWAATSRVAGTLSWAERETEASIAKWRLPTKGYARPMGGIRVPAMA